ncbi:MAG: hypothetical protein E8A46_28755 [Bradyrhizobium sp.]|jgi:hypothetical protein|uniref:hypothetical protein n=1 Tax=Bradyrhizobium sp. TaxID=376 RepID=UPI0011F8B940|nr:hypothetical protein [Bradyrhizobium sp.]THD45519.1 MAG: hypothetical protein E8A46_28755 [Bradyrhizobium sp.]
MLGRLGIVLYWCGLAIASLCEIAAFTMLAMLVANKLSAPEAWMGVVFFVVVGGLTWLAGRAAKYVLAGI